MHLETDDQKVSSLVSQAVEEIETYRDTKDTSVIRSASARLEAALVRDPEYLHALYYRGVARDLLGHARDAIPDLERVLSANPPFVNEVTYHLGVAYYHRYNRGCLEQAVEHLCAVTRGASDPLLVIQARVVLTQAYAMMVIQPDPRAPHLDDARRCLDLCCEQYSTVVDALNGLADFDRDLMVYREIEGTAENAKGMALMYSSDYFGVLSEKSAALYEALGHLERADRGIPNDWANFCDRGSAHMRLGHWTAEATHFRQALVLLERVVQALRPGYGFALYEIGRTHRLMGRFDDALRYLDRAIEIPYEYRDVSDRRIDIERERTAMRNTDFP